MHSEESGSPHRIRLHGPWWLMPQPGERLATLLPSATRASLPLTPPAFIELLNSSLATNRSERWWIRPFRLPAGIAQDQTLALLLEPTLPLQQAQLIADSMVVQLPCNNASELWNLTPLLSQLPPQAPLQLALRFEAHAEAKQETSTTEFFPFALCCLEIR